MNTFEYISHEFSSLQIGKVYDQKRLQKRIDHFIKNKTIVLKETDGCPTLVPFHWYMGQISLGDIKGKSSGEGHNKRVAQMRCIGELLERIPIYSGERNWQQLTQKKQLKTKMAHVKTSNGLSFSLNPILGIYNSYREIVEREVIMDYWFKKQPCKIITPFNKWSLATSLSGLKNDIKSHFYYFPNNYGLHVVSCHLYSSKEPPYQIFGYGCHDDIELAIEKAYFEAWRFYWEYSKLKNPKSFYHDVKSHIDHFYYYALNPDRPEAFFPSHKISLNNINKSCERIDYTEIMITDLSDYKIGGYSVKVRNSEFHEFTSGKLEKDRYMRLKDEVHPVA